MTMRNMKDIEKYVKEKARKALEEVATMYFEEWKSLIHQRVYVENRLRSDANRESGDYYKRTEDFLNSLTIEWVGELELQIGYNTDMIRPSMMLDKTLFNRHTSFSGQDMSELIPLFIEQGQGSHIHSYRGIDTYSDILELVNTSFLKYMSEKLKK